MKIVLLRDIKGLGKKFEIKNVSDGYARNFLIVREFAVRANEKTVKDLELKAVAWRKKEEEVKKNFQILAEKLPKEKFLFKIKTGKKGEVFGSINKEDLTQEIKRKFKDESFEVMEIFLDRAIKSLGAHEVKINLGKGVETKITVIIEPEEH